MVTCSIFRACPVGDSHGPFRRPGGHVLLPLLYTVAPFAQQESDSWLTAVSWPGEACLSRPSWLEGSDAELHVTPRKHEQGFILKSKNVKIWFATYYELTLSSKHINLTWNKGLTATMNQRNWNLHGNKNTLFESTEGRRWKCTGSLSAL